MTITSHIDIFAEILNSSFFTMKQSEIKKKYPYVERDISWMYFNQRILLEAARPEVPLLERLTFLGIYSNNLDEFFRVRVATLNRIVEYADKNIQAEQETAACTLKQIGKLHNRYYKQFEEIFASIMEELKKENIYVIKDAEMTDEQKAAAAERMVLPIRFSSMEPARWTIRQMRIFTLPSVCCAKMKRER